MTEAMAKKPAFDFAIALALSTAVGYTMLYLYKWSYLTTLSIPKDFLEYDIIEMSPIIVGLLPIVNFVMFPWPRSADFFRRLIHKNPLSLYVYCLAFLLAPYSVLGYWATGDFWNLIIGFAAAMFLIFIGRFVLRGHQSAVMSRYVQNRYAWLVLMLFIAFASSSIAGIGAARNNDAFIEILDLHKEHPASLLIGLSKYHDKLICIEIDSTLTFVYGYQIIDISSASNCKTVRFSKINLPGHRIHDAIKRYSLHKSLGDD